jgi:Flp pilus assembly protein TadD
VSGAIELDPKHAIAYGSWAAALANLGSHKEAIEKYDKATKFGAQDAFVYTNWGISLARPICVCFKSLIVEWLS